MTPPPHSKSTTAHLAVFFSALLAAGVFPPFLKRYIAPILLNTWGMLTRNRIRNVDVINLDAPLHH